MSYLNVKLIPISEFVRLLHSYGFLSLTPDTDKERRYFLLIDAYHEFLMGLEFYGETSSVDTLENAQVMFIDAGVLLFDELPQRDPDDHNRWLKEFQFTHDKVIESIKKGYAK